MSEAVNVGLITSADVGDKVVIGLSVEDVGESMRHFGWPDYLVFVLMLLICVLIGVYFGFFHTVVDSQDYLVGGRKMKVFPISMSLIASFISGVSLLGIPTEIYAYGIQYIYILFGILIMVIVQSTVYLPVFHELRLTSIYEYLVRRFDTRVRIFGSILFTVEMVAWLPIVVYVPALAFNQDYYTSLSTIIVKLKINTAYWFWFCFVVTGLNVHLITPIVCVICIFYTSLGGIKAVVWTDVIQTMIMIGVMLVVTIKATVDVGGLTKVWEVNWNSSRIEGPNLDINLQSRHTLWSLTIGGFVYWLQAAGMTQIMMQRYLAVPTLKLAKRSLWIFFGGISFITCLCVYVGLVIYATFHKCDPLTTMLAREKDQLLPLLVMQTLGKFPGLPGLFVAGIFSAALSSLSTGLNSMGAVVLEDFYGSAVSRTLKENQKSLLMKLTVLILGCICVGLVLVVEQLGTVLQLSMSIKAIASGPALGLFTMGVLLPWINSKGALIGGVTGLVSMAWLCFRAQAAIATGDLVFPEKSVSTSGCHYDFAPKQSDNMNIHYDPSVNVTDVIHTDESFMIHRLSYLWYTIAGLLVTVGTGTLVSFLSTPMDPKDIDPALLSPVIRKFIKPREVPKEPADGIINAFDLNLNKLCLEEPTHDFGSI